MTQRTHGRGTDLAELLDIREHDTLALSASSDPVIRGFTTLATPSLWEVTPTPNPGLLN